MWSDSNKGPARLAGKTGKLTGRKPQRGGPTSRVQGSLDHLPQLTPYWGWPLKRVSCLWLRCRHSLWLAARLQRASLIVFTDACLWPAPTPHHAKAFASSFTLEPCRREAKSVEAHRGQHSPTWGGRQEDVSISRKAQSTFRRPRHSASENI